MNETNEMNQKNETDDTHDTGALVVVEGIDGTGKTTLAKALVESLKKRGIDAVYTFEPTDGHYGRLLRESFSGVRRISPKEELRLFIEDRREHVKGFIGPNLAKGRVVVCDRYYLSTMAYQGARGMDWEKIKDLNETFAPRPDCAILLCLEPGEALRRITEKRGENPNNFEALEYLERVKSIFDALQEPYIKRIDASRAQDEVLEEALEHVLELLS